MVHVDDFLATGAGPELKWLKGKVQEKFECTGDVLGPDEGQKKEVRYLNRILRWTDRGIEYEADDKHVNNILRELGMLECSSAITPGVKEDDEFEKTPDSQLNCAEKTQMRKVIALANYLSQDRPSLGFAVKEMARTMACPNGTTSKQVKRLARFIQGAPREVHLLRWQTMPKFICVQSDSDWAGCKRT